MGLLINIAVAQSTQVETLIDLDGELKIEIKQGNESAPLEYQVFINNILVGGGNFSITIVNGTIQSQTQTIPLKGSYRKQINLNQTELYLLSNALELINFTERYINCSTELMECKHDIQFESNFTSCKMSLDSTLQSTSAYQQQITQANDELSSLKTHRIILLLLALALGFLAYKFYSQTVLKQAKNNWRTAFPNRIQ
jgi:hypothetical protein